MANSNDSWSKILLVTFLIPGLLTLGSSYVIPAVIEDSHKTEAVRTARLNKSLEVGSRDLDFTSKLNVLMTMMHTFNQQSIRGKFSPAELKQARLTFQKEYTDQYLALDAMAWWWYWNLEREAQVFDLLSPADTQKMMGSVQDYGDNVKHCVAALHPMWSYLSSSEYKIGKIGQSRTETLEAKMDSDVTDLNNKRVLLVKNIAMLFAQSKYEPKQ